VGAHGHDERAAVLLLAGAGGRRESGPGVLVLHAGQVSDDGGTTVRNATVGLHVDHHAMWLDPNDPDHFVVGNDGGIGITWDKGGNYVFPNTMPLGQFYHVSYNMEVPYRVCGGLQDNGTWCGPSRKSRGGSATPTGST
jgi:hypothetical protein